MAKDIKMYKGNDQITINENNLAHYEKLGYKTTKETIQQEELKENNYGYSSRKRGRSKDRS